VRKRPASEIPTNEPPRFYWELWRDPTQKYIPYFWEELISQAMILFLFLGIMGGLALLWPADLAPRANVLVTPAGIKPEWYFLGVVFVLLIVLPFVDRSPERNPRYKPVTTTIALVIIIALVGLTVWGAISA
jgi:quinol-cytochrome oxidoreductase complex cytochrome b subunit